ncbi:MAG: hypothetical protein LBE78_12920 [Burkholderiaceae bacterium]|jgi:hypothetical protein|nr:hypothetical protein [Burkholderiaceae bacterium]
MIRKDYCCFKGRGEISLATYADYIAKTAGLVPVGNAPALSVNVTEQTEEVTDYTSPTGGVACRTREIQTVDITLTLMCHQPRNLVRALYGVGEPEGIATTAIVAEPHTLFPESVAPLDYLVDDSVAVEVKSLDGQTDYEAGKDYVLTPSGSIKWIEGSTIPVPTAVMGVGQDNIAVSYTRKVQTVIELFAKLSDPVTLHFDGVNAAASPAFATHFDLYKVRLSAAQNFALIGDNIHRIELTGVAERDMSRPAGTLADPLSQFGTLKL